MNRSVRTSPQADDDYSALIQWSVIKFGPKTMKRYDMLITQAIYDLTIDPFRLGSRARHDLCSGLYFYHIKHSKCSVASKVDRILHPRHIIAYRLPSATELHIIRILHERMEFNQQNYPIEYLN